MFNINVYDLVRRFQSLNRFFEGVVGRGWSDGDGIDGMGGNKEECEGNNNKN